MPQTMKDIQLVWEIDGASCDLFLLFGNGQKAKMQTVYVRGRTDYHAIELEKQAAEKAVMKMVASFIIPDTHRTTAKLCNHVGALEPACRIYISPPTDMPYESWCQFESLLDGVYGVHDTYMQKSTGDVPLCIAVDFVLNEVSPEMLLRIANEFVRILQNYKVTDPDLE